MTDVIAPLFFSFLNLFFSWLIWFSIDREHRRAWGTRASFAVVQVSGVSVVAASVAYAVLPAGGGTADDLWTVIWVLLAIQISPFVISLIVSRRVGT